jgi:pimeloyl-ACP methyl ester carboxylesterase
MRFLLKISLALVGLPLSANAACAQGRLAWSEWETSAVEKRGPERAEAVLLYFHGRATWDVTKYPIMSIFIEMAKVAGWDILRVNRHPKVDVEGHDDVILRLVADRIADLRRDGYKKVIVGGGSGGGWLALLASTLPGVDAAIGLAPGTAHGRSALLRTGENLGRKLAGAKAKRIAVFFFEGDFLEDLEIRRSFMIRPGLEKSGATFTIVDHPPDLHGHNAMATGRLVRRYRDCLLKLVRDADLPPGEIECSRATGFAVGSDIGFPAIADLPKLPPDANPALLPYLGRWEGDDEWGAYLILEATEVGSHGIRFSAGHSDAPGSVHTPWMGSYRFRLNESDGSIFLKFSNGQEIITARLTAAMEFEMVLMVSDDSGQITTRDILLRRRMEETGGNRH